MANHSVEISVRGKWTSVPALEVHGKTIISRGSCPNLATILDEEWLDTEVEDPEFCVKKLKEEGIQGQKADIFTFAQMVPETTPKHGYAFEWDSIAAIRTSSYKDWWESLPQESRKNVRRAEKRGVVVKVLTLDEKLVSDIVGVNNDSPLRQNVPYAHYGKTFDEVKKDQSSFLDRSDFICAYHGDEMIGFIKMVRRGTIASILQILPKASHQDKRPANALIAKAVALCEEKGISYLTYGMFSYGRKRQGSLLEFKMRNGFTEILVPRFYIPLTLKGSICFRLKLHRSLVGILPQYITGIGVSFRGRWYRLWQFIRRCSSMVERPNRNRQTECSNPPTGSKI